MTQLKVGDRIYEISYYEINCIHTVLRTTKTMAICKICKFNIKINEAGEINCIPRNSGFGNYSYWIETPELKEQLLRQNTLYKIKNYKYENLSTDELQSILNILNKKGNE